MAHTLEFWKTDDKIFVEFNLKKYGLAEFLELPEAVIIINRIYDKIVVDHRESVTPGADRMAVVAGFIKENFLQKDNSMDVVILGNGSVVKFDLERS